MVRRNNFFTPYVTKNKRRVRYYINKKYNGVTLLYLACARQNEKMVKLLLDFNANLNIQNVGGKTALHVACSKNNLKIVKMLVSKNADLNICDNIGNTPLHLACSNGNEEIVALLLNKNVNINIPNIAQVLPLHLACHTQNYNIAKLLIDRGTNVNARAKYGITPLHYACCIGSYTITKLLLSACANPNIQDERGRLAINIACFNNYPDIVNELIKANSSVPLNIIDWAIQREEMEILKSLARRKDTSKYLIKKLIVSNKAKLLREIRKAKINLNSMEEVDGVTLLELAVKDDNVDLANILMAYNFGDVNNTISKLNELVNNVCVNELLEGPINEQKTIIKNTKTERESENILDILHQCKILERR